ncbi:MAG: hypothetical protein GIS02_03725 [Methanosarcinales archaeon]|uniref:Uncharacterized protein n=1 Tax=Candidatus Ethanoperedens thermophilum TaxID=2766897 RepID=A0A848D980_9EURY|nr:hypothetical protein [Candidatus Ethanoperedens thermophilum]
MMVAPVQRLSVSRSQTEARITDIASRSKAIPKAFSKENVDEIEGVGLHPLRYILDGVA